jgi:fluoride ion exporter CrcB/FEX
MWRLGAQSVPFCGTCRCWRCGAPWGTLGVNVLGSFLIGLLFVMLAGRMGCRPC